MLFELMAIATPLLCIWCYRQGLRDGRSKGDLPPVLQPVRRKAKESKQQAYFDTIERNLDRYDGTSKGQEVVR